MFLKINDFKYLNLSNVGEISLENRGKNYIVYVRRGGSSEVIFTTNDKSKADLFISKILEQENIVDVSSIIYEVDPPEVYELIIEPTDIYKNDEVRIVTKFTSQIKQVSEVTLNVGSNMTVKTPLALSQDRTYATATYTATTSGECIVSAKLSNGKVTKQSTLNIKAHPEVATISASPQTVENGRDINVTISLDLPIENTSDIIITADDKVTIKTPLALDTAKRNATIVYIANKVGQSTVTAKTRQGATTKQVNITINEPAPPSMTVENVPATLTVGQQQTLRIALTNATDYEVTNDNTEAATYTKETKILRAVSSNGRPVNLTFTPTKGSVRGTQVNKAITINPAETVSEAWLGRTI